MSGYPSVEKPWLEYYKDNAFQEANDIPDNKTIWDVIEESLHKYNNIPAIEYFGNTISRGELIENVYAWASAFEELRVQEDEVVAYYGPFLPETAYIMFALNIIGACPYFLKLAIDTEDLEKETKECKVAIVFNQMWNNVSEVFSKMRFETVISLSVADSMPPLKKMTVSAIEFIKKYDPKHRRILSVSQVKKLHKGHGPNIEAVYKPERKAFITSSSGTTVEGVVKGVVATNEAAIAQIMMADKSGCQYFPSEKCLNHFPPTAATSLNILFLLPLYRGMTIVIDPRISENDFFNQVTKYNAGVICATGSAWEAFFNRLEHEMQAGNQYDFSCARAWVVGGEGTDVKKFRKWQKLMLASNSKVGLASAYGCSEVFSAACSEYINARYDFSKPIMSVGIPFAGITVGVFDDNGNELGYNERGELRIKSKSAMKEYYKKPELTLLTKRGNWIKTGDLAEIDEKGFVYIWGRVNDTMKLSDGTCIYLFDIENEIKSQEYIEDAIVLNKMVNNTNMLIAHIVWSNSVKKEEHDEYLLKLTEHINNYRDCIKLNTYAVHDLMLPYSPTTLKKDKNGMMKQSEGYVMVQKGEIKKMRFVDAGNGLEKCIYE